MTTLETADTWPGMDDDCRNHECGYYTRYIAYGPPELNHEGYHAAEDQSAENIRRWGEHSDGCATCQIGEVDCRTWGHFADTAGEWEARLRV